MMYQSSFLITYFYERATVNFKTAVAKCLALIAFNLNNEISSYFRWLFERLQITSSNSIEREKERKFWLLFSLKEVGTKFIIIIICSVLDCSV